MSSLEAIKNRHEQKARMRQSIFSNGEKLKNSFIKDRNGSKPDRNAGSLSDMHQR
jgi:hypothetical protein